jgi:hypothetical protein
MLFKSPENQPPISSGKTINLQTSSLHKYQIKQQPVTQQVQKRRNIQVFEDIQTSPLTTKHPKAIVYPSTAINANSPTNVNNMFV